MRLLETFVYISAKDQNLEAGLKTAKSKARKEVTEMQKLINSLTFKGPDMRSLITGAFGLFAAKKAVDSLIGSTVAAGDSFADMAKRTGVAVETLSALDFVAGQTGTQIEDLEKSMKILSNNMLDVARGTGESRKTFKELGIAVKDSSGNLRPVVDVLMDAADTIGGMTDATKQAAFANDLFGRSGTALLPMLKEGRAGIQAMMDEAKRLGVVMSGETAAASDELGDSTAALMASIEGLKRSASAGIIPVLTDWTKKTTELVVANRELISTKLAEWTDKVAGALEKIWQYKDVIVTAFAIAGITAASIGISKLSVQLAALVNSMMTLGAMESLAAIIGAGGLPLIIGGIVTGVVLLGKAVNDNKESINSFFSNIHDRITRIGQAADKYNFWSLTGIEPKKLPAAAAPGTMAGVENARQYWDITKGTVADLLNAPRTYPALTGSAGGSRGGGGGELSDADRRAQAAFLFGSGRSELMSGAASTVGLGTIAPQDILSFGLGMGAENYAEIHQQNLDEALEREQRFADEVWAIEKSMVEQRIAASEQQMQAATQFGTYWGSMLVSVAEQSGNTFNNIAQMFSQMLKKMAINAAASGLMSGLFNLFTGGSLTFGAAFAGGFKSVLSGRANGGPVYAGTPYIVGERGPELFVPGNSGKIVPNGAGTVDNSRMEIHIHEADLRRMTATDDVQKFARMYKEAKRNGYLAGVA